MLKKFMSVIVSAVLLINLLPFTVVNAVGEELTTFTQKTSDVLTQMGYTQVITNDSVTGEKDAENRIAYPSDLKLNDFVMTMSISIGNYTAWATNEGYLRLWTGTEWLFLRYSNWGWGGIVLDQDTSELDSSSTTSIVDKIEGLNGEDPDTFGKYILKPNQSYDVYIEKTGTVVTVGLKNANDEVKPNEYRYFQLTAHIDNREESLSEYRDLQNGTGIAMTNINLWNGKVKEEEPVGEPFEETFENGTGLWTTNNMTASDGILSSTASSSSATLKGESDCFWKNQEISVRFSFLEYTNGWMQVKFRGNESLLIRPSGLWSYQGGSENILTTFPESLTNGKFYTLNIKVKDGSVRVKLMDGENEIADKSYTAVISDKGGIGFLTSACKIGIEDVKVKSFDRGFSVNPFISEISKGKTITLTTVNGRAASWSTSDTAAATVDNNGKVTGISTGVVTITATDGSGVSAKATVVVYEDITGAAITHEVGTLEAGDTIGLSLEQITPETGDITKIVWESSDKNVIEVQGTSYTRKTIKAVGQGTAELIVKRIDQTVLCRQIVNVIKGKEKAYTGLSYGELKSTGIVIPDMFFGMHTPYTKKIYENQIAKDAFSEFGFKFNRTFESDPQSADTYALSKDNNIPLMIGLDIKNKTTAELLADVKAMRANLSNKSTIYVELGNEVYAYKDYGAEAYIAKCREVSTALRDYAKQENFEIKIAISIWGDILLRNDVYNAWTEPIKDAGDCYDAVVIHYYSDFEQYKTDGKTPDEAMEYLYSTNQNIIQLVEDQKEVFPDKELWYTEYGFLILDMFYAKVNGMETSEMARMQFANSVGEAVTNAEKVFTMLSTGKIEMSSYHCFLDTEGFGIIGKDDKKMPTYYTMKKASELITQNTHIYPEAEIYADTTPMEGDMKSEYQNIAVWGFGDASDVKYVAISNRNPNLHEFSLEGYQLKPVWSYGSDKPLGEYLSQKNSYMDVEPVPTPKTYTVGFGNSVILDGYSMTVCEVQEAQTENVYISLNSSRFNFMTDRLVIAGASEAQLYKKGELCDATVTLIGNGYYEVKPQEGFIYDTDYTVKVWNFERSFHTIAKPEFETYSSASTSISGNYSDFVLTFDLEPKNNIISSFSDMSVSLRGGSIKFQKDGNILVSFNDKSDVLAGVYASGFASDTTIKIAAYGNYVYIWAKAVGDNDFTYICKLENIDSAENSVTISEDSGYFQDYTTSNIKITSPGSDENKVEFKNGSTISMRPLGNAKISAYSHSDKQVLIAVFNNSILEKVMTLDEYNTSYVADSDKIIKVFVWNSLQDIGTDINAYISIDSSFLRR